MLRWRYGIRALAVLVFFIVSFVVTANERDVQRAVDLMMRSAPDLYPVQIWQIKAGTNHRLSLENKPQPIYLDRSDSGAHFRFQLAATPVAISAFYRLVGQDNDWQSLSNGITTLTYNTLPAGHYRLEVRLSLSPHDFGVVYSVADIWVASAWGRTSGWIFLASLIVVLCWWASSCGILQYRRRVFADTDVGQEKQGAAAPASSHFLIRLAEECRTSMMLMAADDELQQTTYIRRGYDRLQGLLQQLHYYATSEQDINQQTPIILRSWLLPRLEWYCNQAESGKLTYQTVMIPDAVVTLDSQLLDEWLNALLKKAILAAQPNGDISILCMLEHSLGSLVLRVMYSGGNSSGMELIDLQDVAFDLLQCRLTQSGGHYHTLKDDEGRAGWELSLPSSWNLLEGSSPECQRISVPISPDDAPQLLIVESDPDMLPLLLAWLGGRYRLLFSASVHGAFERVQEEMIDLVLCTALWLPDGEPGELLSRLKGSADTNHIPFILCCACGSPDSEARAWDGLADDYLALPLVPKMLCLRLQALLENRQRVRAWLKEYLIFGEPKDVAQSDITIPPKVEGLDQQFSDELYAQACQLLSQGTISLDTLAIQMGLSSRTLQRKLQSLFGVNYSDYVRKIQMQLVVSQLEQGGSVKMAARIAGFRDQAYLTRVFRQSFNMSPTEYRKRFAPSEKLAQPDNGDIFI
ncbi:helix-turn-helix domain-containing protein [uncultured Tolumonas sp.]|uniref:helix-turn-helix domain-containing protein n=1 Tax=uncultured Tolumonas sp. TaxID=263765 RepID=UPI002A0A4547|nr:helix-turn-helix domain-containing protein [uncultured Tolumonas sp.]